MIFMRELTEDLVKSGYLKSERIIKTFEKTDRIDFVPDEMKPMAYENSALPIGYGQTISQPLTVAFMFELLDPKPGQKILDVGSGSGWTTAMLSAIAGIKGKVIALERIRELVEFGKNNAAKYNYIKKGIAEFHLAGRELGFPQEAPYDRILVSAAALEIPDDLKRQLKIGGKMVIPVGSSIFYVERKSEDEFSEKEYPGFAFVPLITK
jgi:protein-L-isoaspartate(D-aspartate) O-methyltransferase